MKKLERKKEMGKHGKEGENGRKKVEKVDENINYFQNIDHYYNLGDKKSLSLQTNGLIHPCTKYKIISTTKTSVQFIKYIS